MCDPLDHPLERPLSVPEFLGNGLCTQAFSMRNAHREPSFELVLVPLRWLESSVFLHDDGLERTITAVEPISDLFLLLCEQSGRGARPR